MWRRTVGDASMGLGAVWGFAALGKMIFGIRVTMPFVPPVDLTRVDVTHALVMAGVFVSLGAVLRRWSGASEDRRAAQGDVPDESVRMLGAAGLDEFRAGGTAERQGVPREAHDD